MHRILVVEDEAKLLRGLERGLTQESYTVATAASGEEGYYLATTQEVDAVVLDLMLPGRDGMQVLRDLRSQDFAAQILILTARDAVDDRVAGLDAGADDSLAAEPAGAGDDAQGRRPDRPRVRAAGVPPSMKR